MTFNIPLSEPRVTLQQSTALHMMVAILLCAVGFASGVLFWFTDVSPTVQGAYVPFAIFGSACFVAGLVIGALTIKARRQAARGSSGRTLRIAELILLLGATTVFAIQGWNFPALLFAILAGAVLFALLGETHAPSNAVRFDEGGVYRPFAVRARCIQWHGIRRVLLRHGALTIDLMDNRLFQYRVAEHDMDAEIFEAWAAAQVEKGNEAKPKNDW